MKRHLYLFLTATRFALVEQVRNRFAILLVVVFIPTWITLAHTVISTKAVPFQLKAIQQVLTPAGNELTQIVGALNATTMIIGFMMFAAGFSGAGFDRRLAMAGYPRGHLVLAKFATLTAASAVVVLYAVFLVRLFWTPRQPLLFTLALLCGTMTYGALGTALASLLHREVEGMFAIVMASAVDVGLQNPTYMPGAGSDLVRYLPSYGAVQAGTGAGFSTTPVWSCLALQLAWFVAASTIGLISFQRRTRNSTPRPKPRQSNPYREHHEGGSVSHSAGTPLRADPPATK